MRNVLIAILLICVVVLSLTLRSRSNSLERQRRELQQLTASKSLSASLELQDKCAQQARQAYREDQIEARGFGMQEIASFMRRCGPSKAP